jgi:hypothetical protein
MTLSRKTLSRKTLSRKKLSRKTLSRKPLSIKTLSIMDLFAILSINDIQNNVFSVIMVSAVTLNVAIT